MTALQWDQWRANYAAMTYAEQETFHSAIYNAYPVQHHYSPDLARRAIEQIQPRTVVELGGWDGALADEMLAEHPSIEQWTNVEICREAATTCTHPRYTDADLGDWYWSRRWTADLMVASHVIEHLTAEDLERVVAATDARALFMDAPLTNGPQTWAGFTGTHILGIGWDGVTEICERYGYALDWAVDHVTEPSSGDKARACLYISTQR